MSESVIERQVELLRVMLREANRDRDLRSLAAEMGTSASTLSRFIRGTLIPRPETLIAIEKWFDVV